MNPLYQMYGGVSNQPVQAPKNPMSDLMMAMRNPPVFIKQRFPDIPDEIANDPNRILGYLQQTRGISNQQIQNLVALYQNGRM